jgi:transcriptional regulator with XRE-family HTH domain
MKQSYQEPDYTYGTVMFTLRTEIGLTQKGLGDLLGISGRAVAQWEAGKCYPKAEHLKKVIVLAVQHQAFPQGSEAEAIRALWKAAHQKMFIDEQWLYRLLENPLSGQRNVQLHVEIADGATPQVLVLQTKKSAPIIEKSSSTLSSLPGLHQHWMSAHQQRIFMSLVFFAIGFSAITALAIAIVGWADLSTAAYLLIWPSLVLWLVIGILYPDYGTLAFKGFVIGLLACFFYDCMRFVSIELGLWSDFIPRIGMWLLHTNKPDWLIGYIWRYVGDGGFMGIAFVVCYCLLKPKLDVRIAALAFGLAIWLCLIGTILLAPHGTEMLFPLTPLTFSLSLLGHIIYGLSIGLFYPVFIRERVDTQHSVSTTCQGFSLFKVSHRDSTKRVMVDDQSNL